MYVVINLSCSLEMERDKSQWDTEIVNEAVQLMLDIVLNSGDTFNVRVITCRYLVCIQIDRFPNLSPQPIQNL